MSEPSGFEYSEGRERKERVFGYLRSRGIETHFDPLIDVLFTDLNGTLSTIHTGMRGLRKLDPEIAEKAEIIMSMNIPRNSKIISIAKLVKGKTVSDTIEAGKKVAEEADIPTYLEGINMKEEIARLNETKLVIFTNSPREFVRPYAEMKIYPVYNSNGRKERKKRIILYSTVLEEIDGVYTGEILSMPDDQFRTYVMNEASRTRTSEFVSALSRRDIEL